MELLIVALGCGTAAALAVAVVWYVGWLINRVHTQGREVNQLWRALGHKTDRSYTNEINFRHSSQLSDLADNQRIILDQIGVEIVEE